MSKMGRPRVDPERVRRAIEMIQGGTTVCHAAKVSGVSRQTLTRMGVQRGKLSAHAIRRVNTARWFTVSTAGYKRRVFAKTTDRAAVVFFLKEQPQIVGFAMSIREDKRNQKRDGASYASTSGVLEKYFPELQCVPGRTKNSFRVIERGQRA